MKNIEARSEAEEKEEKKDIKKEFEEQVEKQQEVVEDKKKVAEKAQDLNLKGTTEGAEEVEKDIKEAGKEIDAEMERQYEKFEGIKEKAEEQEDIIELRADETEEDIRLAENLSNDVNTEEAKDQIQNAREKAEGDKNFLEAINSERKKTRDDMEKETDRQLKEVMNQEINVG